MKWHVFKRDDPSTYPEVDCPVVVRDDLMDKLYICRWDNNISKFYEKTDDGKKLLHCFKECFYAHIGYLPYIEKEYRPVKCGMDLPRCVHYDDGYCMSENKKCKSAKVVTEYALGMKRIWKDFE